MNQPAQYGLCGCGCARAVRSEYCQCCGHFVKTVLYCPDCD